MARALVSPAALGSPSGLPPQRGAGETGVVRDKPAGQGWGGEAKRANRVDNIGQSVPVLVFWGSSN
jgi:hypothetical protein